MRGILPLKGPLGKRVLARNGDFNRFFCMRNDFNRYYEQG